MPDRCMTTQETGTCSYFRSSFQSERSQCAFHHYQFTDVRLLNARTEVMSCLEASDRNHCDELAGTGDRGRPQARSCSSNSPSILS